MRVAHPWYASSHQANGPAATMHAVREEDDAHATPIKQNSAHLLSSRFGYVCINSLQRISR